MQQKITLNRINTVNKVTKAVTSGEWSKGSWEAVKSETIENYKDPTPAVVEKVEVNSTTEDGVINVYYEPKDTPPSITEPEPKPSPSPAPAPIQKPKPVPVSILNPDPSPAPCPNPEPEPKPNPAPTPIPNPSPVQAPGPNPEPEPAPKPKRSPTPGLPSNLRPEPELKLRSTPIKKIVEDENQQKNKLANTGLESDSIRIYGLMLLGVSLVMIKQRKYIK